MINLLGKLMMRIDSPLSYKVRIMIKTHFFLAWLCFLLPCLSLASEALPEKVYKIGISEWTGYPDSVKGFKDSMNKSGFVEGRNVRLPGSTQWNKRVQATRSLSLSRKPAWTLYIL